MQAYCSSSPTSIFSMHTAKLFCRKSNQCHSPCGDMKSLDLNAHPHSLSLWHEHTQNTDAHALGHNSLLIAVHRNNMKTEAGMLQNHVRAVLAIRRRAWHFLPSYVLCCTNCTQMPENIKSRSSLSWDVTPYRQRLTKVSKSASNSNKQQVLDMFPLPHGGELLPKYMMSHPREHHTSNNSKPVLSSECTSMHSVQRSTFAPICFVPLWSRIHGYSVTRRHSSVMGTDMSVQLIHTSQFCRLKEDGARMSFSLALNLVMGLHTVHLKRSLLRSSKSLLVCLLQICISQLHLQPYPCYSVRPPFDAFNCLHKTEPLYICTRIPMCMLESDYFLLWRLSGYTEWSKSFYLRV